MQQIKEFITNDNGFFSTFATEYPELYLELFADIQPSKLDIDLLVNCGERYASPLLIHYDLKNAVDYVINRYADNWKRIKEALFREYNILQPFDNKKITTQEKQGISTNESTVTDKTAVNTFDSTEPVDKEHESTENSGTHTANETIKMTVEQIGISGNIPASNLILNELEVRKNSFISIVIGDVKTQLSLDIY